MTHSTISSKERGYDFVLLLHGDGQYAPEIFPQAVESPPPKGPTAFSCCPFRPRQGDEVIVKGSADNRPGRGRDREGPA